MDPFFPIAKPRMERLWSCSQSGEVIDPYRLVLSLGRMIINTSFLIVVDKSLPAQSQGRYHFHPPSTVTLHSRSSSTMVLALSQSNLGRHCVLFSTADERYAKCEHGQITGLEWISSGSPYSIRHCPLRSVVYLPR